MIARSGAFKIIFVFSLVITTYCQAQKNYEPGYVVFLNRDTLRGFVDNRQWAKNPKRISFRQNLGDRDIEYSVKTIQEFGAGDKIYVRAAVDVEEMDIDGRALRNSTGEFKHHADTIFLESLVRGQKELFVLENSLGRLLFYIRKETGFEWLVNRQFTVYTGKNQQQKAVMEVKEYPNQLSEYLRDCLNIRSRVESLRYDRSSLTSVFRYYYSCSGKKSETNRTTTSGSIEFGLVTGVSFTTLSYTGEAVNNYLIRADYPSSTAFAGGAWVNFILRGNVNKFSIYNELLYSSFKTSGSYLDYKDADQNTMYFTNQSRSYMKLNSMLRFQIPAGKLSFFANGGITNAFVLSNENRLKAVRTLYTQITTSEGTALKEVQKYQNGFLVGVGLKVSRFSMEGRYERLGRFTPSASLSGATSGIYVLLGYRL